MSEVLTTDQKQVNNIRTYWDCWRLETDRGRQVWRFTLPKDIKSEDEFYEAMSQAFIFDKSKNPNSADRVYRDRIIEESFNPTTVPADIPEVQGDSDLDNSVFKSIYKGVHFYQHLQMEDGHWPGDYGGPLFLLPGLIIASYISDSPFFPCTQGINGTLFIQSSK